ncbi:MAG: glycosyltransferase family 4 protein [Patescibacteria group bacterium]
MKLLLINYEFPPLGGGAGNATKNIAQEMAKRGNNVVVLTTWFPGLPERELTDGYEIIRVLSMRSRLDRSNPMEMLDFVRLARKEATRLAKEESFNATVAFFAIPSGLIARYLKKKFGVPYIVSLRGGDVPGFLPSAFRFWHFVTMPFTKLIWKDASVIVANSEGLRELALHTACPLGKNVFMISNGVDTELFSPRPAPKVGPFTILFAGRLVEQKGVTHLLKSCAKLKEEGKTFILNIAGDGPLRGKLESETKALGLSSQAHFLGWVSRDKLPELYREANLFALPSFDEGMPNVILEAMSSGLPIVATDIKGNNELVKNEVNGFLYKRQEELTPILKKCIENKGALIDMGPESRKISLDYSWRKVAESYEKLLS